MSSLSYTLLQYSGGKFHATLTSRLKATRGSAGVRSMDHRKPFIGPPSHPMRGVPGLGSNPRIHTPRFPHANCIPAVTNAILGTMILKKGFCVGPISLEAIKIDFNRNRQKVKPPGMLHQPWLPLQPECCQGYASSERTISLGTNAWGWRKEKEN